MKNKKITLKEFFNSDKNLVIHCDTEEKANILLKAFDKMGEKWCDGTSYLEDNNWRYHKEETCYASDGTLSGKEFFLDNDYKVYEFGDVELGGRTMNDNAKKIFEMLGVEPNEKFKVKFKNRVDNEFYYHFDDELFGYYGGDYRYPDLLRDILAGEVKIVKLPKKKKLRDLTVDDLKKWTKVNCKVNCKVNACDDCPFANVSCNAYDARIWVNHKDLYSDKFLDQEVEVPE